MRTDPVPADASTNFVDCRRHDRYRFSAPITVYPKVMRRFAAWVSK